MLIPINRIFHQIFKFNKKIDVDPLFTPSVGCDFSQDFHEENFSWVQMELQGIYLFLKVKEKKKT